MKTAKQIQGDIINLLKGSDLEKAISGKVYRNGLRPTNSTKEDIIVTHTAGIGEQLQSGVITLNIFVEDVTMNKQKVENGKRTAELELLALNWFQGIEQSSDTYYFELKETIKTTKDNSRSQHFVVIKLNYEFLNI